MRDHLRELFATEESMQAFKERYFDAINPIWYYNHEGVRDFLTIDTYGWGGVAMDILKTLSGSMWLEVGDDVQVEICWMDSLTGYTVEILIGTLVEVPVPDPEQMADPEYHDESGYLGGYIGHYIFG